MRERVSLGRVAFLSSRVRWFIRSMAVLALGAGVLDGAVLRCPALGQDSPLGKPQTARAAWEQAIGIASDQAPSEVVGIAASVVKAALDAKDIEFALSVAPRMKTEGIDFLVMASTQSLVHALVVDGQIDRANAIAGEQQPELDGDSVVLNSVTQLVQEGDIEGASRLLPLIESDEARSQAGASAAVHCAFVGEYEVADELLARIPDAQTREEAAQYVSMIRASLDNAGDAGPRAPIEDESDMDAVRMMRVMYWAASGRYEEAMEVAERIGIDAGRARVMWMVWRACRGKADPERRAAIAKRAVNVINGLEAEDQAAELEFDILRMTIDVVGGNGEHADLFAAVVERVGRSEDREGIVLTYGQDILAAAVRLDQASRVADIIEQFPAEYVVETAEHRGPEAAWLAVESFRSALPRAKALIGYGAVLSRDTVR